MGADRPSSILGTPTKALIECSNGRNMNKIEKLKSRAGGYKREPGFVSVVAALVGNFVITILKAIGFAVSGSSSLFSEAVHSLADTANQALLLVGIVKSRKAPDEESSYGYGLERFFWALISACGVFFVGAGITVYHGVDTLLHPGELIFKPEVFIILAVSFVVELITFSIAFCELLEGREDGETLVDTISDGDPTVLAVVYEDGVAVFGVFGSWSFYRTLVYYRQSSMGRYGVYCDRYAFGMGRNRFDTKKQAFLGREVYS